MTDCLAILHHITQDSAAMARLQAELVMAWARRFEAPQRPILASAVPLRATGQAAKRLACPVARRIVEKTEIYWSKK